MAWRKVGDLTPAFELQPIPSEFLVYEGTASNPPEIIRIALENGQIVIQWTGSTLEATPDFINWSNVSQNPSNPYTETPAGKRFFRSK